MMELKSRQVYMLRLILESREGCPLKRVLQKLKITRRAFYYDFEQINQWMRDGSFGELKLESQILMVHTDDMKQLKEELRENNSYFYSIEERRILELLFIFLDSDVVTIEKMQKFFDVSKNTILTDIKEWKRILQEQEISVVSTIKIGYFLQGEEFNIRKFIGQQIQKLENFQPRNVLAGKIQKILCEMCGEEYDYRELARCLIKQYEQDVNIKLVSENEDFECNMILISWIRSMEGYSVFLNAEERATLAVTKPYQSLRRSFRKLKEYYLEIPDVEIYYITTLLLGIKIAQFRTQDQEDLYIYHFTAALIKNFERIAGIAFENRERLANRLRGHIRPLYYRLKYGMQETNLLARDVMNMYPEVYDFTRRAVQEMDDALASQLTEDEIIYLTIYFVSDEKVQVVSRRANNHPPKVLVLCAAGMATSALMKEQLRDLLGQMVEIEIGIVSELNKYHLEQYVLIVSTSYSEELSSYPKVVFTEVVIREESIKKIIEILNEQGVVNRYDRTIRNIIEVVEKRTVGKVKVNELYFDILRELFNSHGAVNSYSYTSFSEYIEQEKYVRLKGFWSPEQLLKKGCQMVAHPDSYQRLYERLGNMIRHHKLKYYEVHKGVMLIHCPMQGDVNREIGFAVAAAEQEVHLTSYISGRIFIFFTEIDQNSHFELLEQIYRYCDSAAGKELLAKIGYERE